MESQLSFDSLGTSLKEATFIVVDLETTGGSPDGADITEIGAVKIRGGEIIGEFQTLINPGYEIPPFITVLTGITDAMVAPAPRIEEVIPTLFAFFGDENSVYLVAHNAPFDISFLKAATEKSGRKWPKYRALDTAKIARRTLTRDEVPNNKLSTLAPFFGADSQPNHRALDDARATVDVFHGLLERLGSFGIETVEDLNDFSHRLTPAQQNKRHLIQGIPTGPGIYIFRGPQNEALYIGVSKNLAARVRNYFSSSEARSRVLEMIALAEKIETIQTPTLIEAEIRELRLIKDLKPRYNRKSKFPEKKIWLKLTTENYPRISTVRGVDSLEKSHSWAGPFAGVEEAELAKAAIYEIEKIRQCRIRITKQSIKLASPCVLYGMDKCGAPCIGAQSQDHYSTIVETIKELFTSSSLILERSLIDKMQRLAVEEKFEEALAIRNRLSAFAKGVSRGENIRSLTRIPEIVLRISNQIVLIKYGKLITSALLKNYPHLDSVYLEEVVNSLRSIASHAVLEDSVLPSGNYEETEKLLKLFKEDVEILFIDDSNGGFCLPLNGATSIRHRLKKSLESNSHQDIGNSFGERKRIDRVSYNRLGP